MKIPNQKPTKALLQENKGNGNVLQKDIEL